MGTRRITILIADDHPMIRDGLASLINSETRFRLVGQASNGREAVQAYKRLRPDVVLLDLRMPECGGLEAVERILQVSPSAQIVILTSFDGEEDIFRSLRAGARSYLLKDASRSDLVNCILLAAQGKRYLPESVAARLADRIDRDQLSQREIDVLRRLAVGDRNKVIGAAMKISESTVKFHVKNILAKLNADNRLQAVNTAISRGVLSLNDCPIATRIQESRRTPA
jgi:DNA-binding NarL/FixJ family response regulator